MNSRERILQDLRVTLPKENISDSMVPADKDTFADFTDDMSTMKKRFKERFQELHGEFFAVSDEAAARTILIRLVETFPEQSCLIFVPEIEDRIVSTGAPVKQLITGRTELSADSPDFARLEAGITGAEYLIARTGSIVLSAARSGGRRLSILPPVHIVIAYAGQLVPSLDSVIGKPDESSYTTIITGPSRTSDIEKKLVLGAHGPKRLIVILIG